MKFPKHTLPLPVFSWVDASDLIVHVCLKLIRMKFAQESDLGGRVSAEWKKAHRRAQQHAGPSIPRVSLCSLLPAVCACIVCLQVVSIQIRFELLLVQSNPVTDSQFQPRKNKN